MTLVALPAFEAIAAADNLQRAFALVDAARGRKTPGCDGVTCDHIRAAGHDIFAEDLSREMLLGHYSPSALVATVIPKLGGGERTLLVPSVFDRVVERAVLLQVEPVIDPTFYPASVGFRPGLGPYAGINIGIDLVMDRTVDFIVSTDIEQAFPSVPHDRVLGALDGRGVDTRTLSLMEKLMKRSARGAPPSTVGIPQGAPLSPFVLNVVLDELDTFIADLPELVAFARYADDFVIGVRGGEAAGREVLGAIEERTRSIGFALAKNKTSIAPITDGFRFLGHDMRRTRKGGLWIHPASSRVERLHMKLSAVAQDPPLPAKRRAKRMNQIARGWSNYFLPGRVARAIAADALAQVMSAPPTKGGMQKHSTTGSMPKETRNAA